jgi:hypothetical protein
MQFELCGKPKRQTSGVNMPDKISTSAALVLPVLEPGEEWLDVILHFADYPAKNSEAASAAPPIAERYYLSDQIWIERLDGNVAKTIALACNPANYNIPIIEQEGHLYAFVRKSRLPGLFNDFGGIEELGGVVSLSRLVHPTTTGFRYAARVSLVNGEVRRVLAQQPRGVSIDVFWSEGTHRNWMTVEDARRLKALMPYIFDRRPLSKRIHNAYWHHEYAVRTFYVDHRWVLIFTGLDALVNIDPFQGKKKFVSRVKKIADTVGISLSNSELERAYDLRSNLVHGQHFLYDFGQPLSKAEVELYDKIEETLRRTLLKTFEDASFASNFIDETSIGAFLPYRP